MNPVVTQRNLLHKWERRMRSSSLKFILRRSGIIATPSANHMMMSLTMQQNISYIATSSRRENDDTSLASNTRSRMQNLTIVLRVLEIICGMISFCLPVGVMERDRGCNRFLHYSEIGGCAWRGIPWGTVEGPLGTCVLYSFPLPCSYAMRTLWWQTLSLEVSLCGSDSR